MKKIALATALALAAPAALAQGGPNYWNVQVGGARADITGLDDYTLALGTVAIGRELIPHLGLEVRGGLTNRKTEDDIKLHVEGFGSLLARFNLLSGDVRPYLLAGGTAARIRVSGPAGSGSETETGFSAGAGISVHVRNAGITFEYLRHLDKDDLLIHGFSIGFIQHF